MIGPIYLSDGDAEFLLRLPVNSPVIGGLQDAIISAKARVRVPKRKTKGKYGWDRLLSEPSPVVFQKEAWISLNDMAKRVNQWARWNGMRVATRQIDGALHVWLIGKPDDGG